MNCEMLPECSTQKHSLEPGIFIIALHKDAIIEWQNHRTDRELYQVNQVSQPEEYRNCSYSWESDT